jgi:putative flippase GtrA
MLNLSRKFLRYFFTGGISAIVDAGGFALLNQMGPVTIRSAIASFVVAAYVNFRLTLLEQ